MINLQNEKKRQVRGANVEDETFLVYCCKLKCTLVRKSRYFPRVKYKEAQNKWKTFSFSDVV